MNPPVLLDSQKMVFRSLFRTSVIIFAFLFGAKLLNFYKKILIGKLFGVSSMADAFFAASYFPYYLAVFFEGVIFLGILPLYAQIARERKNQALDFVQGVFWVTLGMLGLMALALWAGAPWIVRELVPGFSFEEQALTGSLLRILSPVVLFLGFCAFFKAFNSYFKDQALAASSGFLDSLLMIGVCLLTWRFWGIRAAAWASVASALAAMIFQAFFAVRKHHLIPKWGRLEAVWLKQIFQFFIPIAVIGVFQQIPYFILTRFGSGMWEGTISALTIAQTLTTVPMGLVSHTILFAVFPILARQAHEQESEKAVETFFLTFRAAFFILVPVSVLLSASARPLAAIFFSGNGISMEGTRRIANALICFGWATFALYANLYMVQALIAVRKTLPAMMLCLSRALLACALSYLLTIFWDYQGLALGFSLALVLNFFIFFPLIVRQTPFHGRWRELYVVLLKLFLASTPIMFAGFIINHWPIQDWVGAVQNLRTVFFTAASLVIGAGIYLFLLLKFQFKEAHVLWGMIKTPWRPKAWQISETLD